MPQAIHEGLIRYMLAKHASPSIVRVVRGPCVRYQSGDLGNRIIPRIALTDVLKKREQPSAD